ncbi:uncharacterized protein P3T18_001947 [Paraburkholderia sp. GAS199]|uniref:lysozyme inhibitor LprI family protein n=1 Tax=Paraburkholderia sp. GAS199 TaxID=3035126 RepID=UPI003D1D1A4D
MQCTQCGTENSSASSFCAKCGTQLATTRIQSPIWNPSRVAGLSFVFTPAFGSYLQSSNWKSLGQPERAASSKIWFFISLIVLAAMAGVTALFAGKTADGNDAVRGVVNLGGFIYFAVWYYASGRRQINYVKNTFGKQYAKKSMAKPVLAALVCIVAYAAVVFGLLVAAHGTNSEEAQSSEPVSSASPLSALTGLFSTGPKLDCAADSVKQNIAETYTDQLVKTGIPDLVSAVADNRVKVRVDTIRETARNTDSKNADCAANLVIDFPNDDLVRATQQNELFTLVMQSHGYAPLSSPTFAAAVTYQVAVPADATEKKQGLIVAMTTNKDHAVDQQLQTYAAAYEVLSLASPDITATSTNATPWSKEFKDSTIQSCGTSLGVEKCTCRVDALEKVVSEKEMGRIAFAMQDSPAIATRYVNFKKLVGALGQQCPMTRNLASILGDDSATPANAETDTRDLNAAPLNQTTEQSAAQATETVAAQAQSTQQDQVATAAKSETTQSSQPSIAASFDCSKASSKIEKLICSSPQTADADRRLASVYRTAASKSADQSALKQQQRDWLTKERNACGDTTCLVTVTEARIQVLSAM